MKFGIYALAASVLCGSFLTARLAWAGQKMKLSKTYEDSGAVFQGTIKEITVVNAKAGDVVFHGINRHVVFRVEKSWKGAIGPEVTVEMAGSTENLHALSVYSEGNPRPSLVVFAVQPQDPEDILRTDAGKIKEVRLASQDIQWLDRMHPAHP